MYISAKHIAIKKDQDRIAFTSHKIILCDGIGEFADSAKAAEITIENLSLADKKNEISGLIEQSAGQIKKEGIIGGTTLIIGLWEDNENSPLFRLGYLGNGGIFHLHGDFHELPSTYTSQHPFYRFSNLLIPHVDKDGTLLRHISHNSGSTEVIPSFVEISLTGINGDIILLFSDGIASLEEDVIVIDDQKRVWRNQSESALIILSDLSEWLRENCTVITQDRLDHFLENVLLKLKELNKLEDDASIGILITEPVIEYYKSL